MYYIFISILSLISFAHFSGVEATQPNKRITSSTLKAPSSCYTVGIDSASTPPSLACTADGKIIATVNDSTETDTVYFYLTDENSTTLIMPGTYMSTEFQATFPGLVATTYTLQAVVSSAGSCCATNCLSVNFAPPAETSCCALDFFGDSGFIDGSFTLAAFPSLQISELANIPFKLHYEWHSDYNPFILGSGAVLTVPSLPEIWTFTVYGSGPGCCMSADTNINRLYPSCVSTDLVLKIDSITSPSSPCACDGSITVSSPQSANGFPTIYYLTDRYSSISILDNSGEGATFYNLTAGEYYLYVVITKGINYGLGCISNCYRQTLTAADFTSTLTICPVTNQCGNYVKLVAIPGSANTKPSTNCFIQNFVWLMQDSNGTNCVVGTGPTLTVATPGTYTVTGTVPNNTFDCTPTTYVQSNPLPVTLSTCTTPTCPITICGNTNVCAGNEITLCVVGIDDPSDYTISWAGDCCPETNCTSPMLTFQPTTGGTCCVTVTNNNTNCSSTTCLQYTVNNPPSICVQDVCICTGDNLMLEICATSDLASCCPSTPAQLIVTGPASFSYSGPITLNDPNPVVVPVTSYATAANVGSYYVTVVDANGCVATNLKQPARVVVVPCCPSQS